MKASAIFISIIFGIIICAGCSEKPPEQLIETFEKKQILNKNNDMKIYLAESANQDSSGPEPELNKEYEMMIITKTGKNYVGMVGGNKVYVKDDVDIGDKIIARITGFTKSGNAKAELVKKLESSSSTTGNEAIEIDKIYNVEIAGANARGEYYCIINRQKVIVIGAVQSIKKYKVKILDYDASANYYYSQPTDE